MGWRDMVSMRGLHALLLLAVYMLSIAGGRKEDRKKGKRGMEERDKGKGNRGDGKGTSTCRYDIHL